jgi:hypothetical protein
MEAESELRNALQNNRGIPWIVKATAAMDDSYTTPSTTTGDRCVRCQWFTDSISP